MHILKVGINYRTAPVEIREKLTFTEDALPEAMQELKVRKSILEDVIISTCNRTEIYAVADQLHTGRYYIKTFLADWFDLDKDDIATYLEITENEEAIEHLFRVTTGLDSMVLGETQILGQVRDTFLKAQELSTTGTIFNELFKQAITFAKRAHKETAIGEHAVSISYAAVELAKQVFQDISNKKAAVLGAGKMGELAIKNLKAAGVHDITVVNRTFSRAENLAEQNNAKAVPMDDLHSVLKDVDVLLTSTGSSSYVITEDLMEDVQRNRNKDEKLLLIDIAVPRNIDPEIDNMEGIQLYDIDNLQNIIDDNLEARKQAAEEIEFQIDDEINTFQDWVRTLGVVPVISGLRQKALSIQGETMKSIQRKIPDLTEREKKVLNKHTKSIINQLLKEPITQAKELAGTENADDALQLFVDIFGIHDEVEKEFSKQQEKHNTILHLKKENKTPLPVEEKISSAR
jgi:glutamyl-tRNA reductase